MIAAEAYNSNSNSNGNNISLHDGTRQQDADWPVKCICNLCDCGDHRCSTFGLMELDGRLSSQGQPVAAAAALDESSAVRHQCNYNCGQSNERYLTTSGGGGGHVSSRSTPAGAGLKSPVPTTTNNNNNNNNNRSMTAEGEKRDELLHVLVTRPEIAGRPRDNIVFEGDMDLRTTFETTYEALAKKRLESWRRHQETQAGKPPADEAASRAQLDVSVVQDTSAVSGGRPEREAVDEGAGFEADIGQSTSRRRQSTSRRRQSPRPGPTPTPTPPPPARPLEARPTQLKHQQLQQLHQRPAGVEVEVESKPRRAARTAKPMGLAAIEPTDEQFIDPDLSPIIVYDANMNRLEKVGIRKRSKYRPSTSLRSGARGLFGDHHQQQDDRQQQRHRQQVADGKASPRKLAAGLSSRGAHYNDRGSPAAITPDVAALEARQALGLTYSDRNLPVDTKRKNLDNVNMIDHIRDMESPQPTRAAKPGMQVASGAALETSSRDRIGEQMGSETDGGGGGGQRRANLQDAAVQVVGQAPDVEDDLDEAVAVAEIQRCTLGSPTPGRQQEPPTRGLSRQTRDTQQQQQETDDGQLLASTGPSPRQATPTPPSRGPSGGTPMSDSTKQNRLQRTCQNQSFYIYENEYPEPRKAHEISYYKLTPIDGELELGGTGRAYAKASSPGEGQRRRLIVAKRNNLFRESPDSTLIVGSHARQRNKLTSAISKDQQPTPPPHQVDTKLEGGRETRTTGRLAASGGGGGGRTSVDLRGGRDFDYYNQSPAVSTRATTTPTTGLAGRDSNARSTTGHTCKVLLLDTDFDFVGHHLGHNYFVEKQLNANEIYERHSSPGVTSAATLVQ